MISQKEIKYLKQLRLKKFREEEKKFVVEGEKMVRELIASGWETESIYATKAWIEKNKKHNRLKVVEIKEKELERISSLQTPNNVLAVVRQPVFPAELKNETGFLLLDNIKDPGNLGTIIRTADWFGIKTIFCSAETVEVYNPKTVQATMGSLFRVKCIYGDLGEWIGKLKNEKVTVMGACMEGEDIQSSGLKEKTAVVLGSESHGISEYIQKLLDQKITIPGTGNAESLNVSVAAGIVCYQFFKTENRVL